MTECWPNFADGFIYLGLIAMERGELDVAVERFDEAIRVGRTLFPRRIGKSRYWSDHDTRPYIRALVCKAQVLNRTGAYEKALQICDVLENECGQDLTAAAERSAICLNSGQLEQARAAARHVHRIYKEENFVFALASFEAGATDDAVVHFLHAALVFPCAARMLTVGRRAREPLKEGEARAYEVGCDLLSELRPYLSGPGRAAKQFFKRLLTNPSVAALLDPPVSG